MLLSYRKNAQSGTDAAKSSLGGMENMLLMEVGPKRELSFIFYLTLWGLFCVFNSKKRQVREILHKDPRLCIGGGKNERKNSLKMADF